MSHYFTNNLNIASNRKELSFRFFGVEYTFISDEGVFSKQHVDTGTIALLNQVFKGDLTGRVCDLGCGYGVVGIALKKQFPECEVFGFDPNGRAVALANENAHLNQVDVEFYQADRLEKSCQHVVFNPPIRAGKEVYYPLFKQAFQYLNEQGCLWVVMRKSHGVESAMKFCRQWFSEVTLLKKEKGHYVFIAKK